MLKARIVNTFSAYLTPHCNVLVPWSLAAPHLLDVLVGPDPAMDNWRGGPHEHILLD